MKETFNKKGKAVKSHTATRYGKCKKFSLKLGQMTYLDISKNLRPRKAVHKNSMPQPFQPLRDRLMTGCQGEGLFGPHSELIG